MQYRQKNMYFNSLNNMNSFRDQSSLNNKNRKTLTRLNLYLLQSPATYASTSFACKGISYSRGFAPRITVSPLDLKVNSSLQQVLDQPKKLKTKSKKFPTFLQFLLYQDLYSSQNKSFKKQQLVNGESPLDSNTVSTGIPNNLKVPSRTSVFTSSKELLKVGGLKNTNYLNHLLISDLDSTLASNFSYTNRKWSSFFPYKKSFLCYWLLPIVGFVGYLSTQDIRQAFILEKQTGNLGWSISLKSSSERLALMPSHRGMNMEGAKPLNRTHQDFLIPSKCGQSPHLGLSKQSLEREGETNNRKNQSISTNLNKVFLFSSNLKLSFKDYWYKTSLIFNSLKAELGKGNGEMMDHDPARICFLESNRNLKHKNLYPDKFYDTPLTSSPFTSSGVFQTTESVNNKSLDVTQKMKNGAFSFLGFKKTFLSKTKNTPYPPFILNPEVESTSGFKMKLIPPFWGGELTKEKKILLGISSTLPFHPPLRGDVNKAQVCSNAPFTKTLNHSYFLPTLAPVFSYQKAMFLMDEYAKALIVSDSPLSINLKNVYNKNNNLENLKKGMKMLPFLINLQTLPGAEVKVQLSDRQISLPNKRLGREKVYHRNALYLYTNSKTFSGSVTALSENSTKLSFLEEIISFLLSESPIPLRGLSMAGALPLPLKGINSNTALGLNESSKATVLTKKEYSSSLQQEELKNGSLFNYTNLTQKNLVNKLTKDQLYFLILNSLSLNQNGTHLNSQSKFNENQTYLINSAAFPSSHREGSSVGSTTTFIPLRGMSMAGALPLPLKVLKLNHPLFFASTSQSENRKRVPANSIKQEAFSQLADSSLPTKIDKNTSLPNGRGFAPAIHIPLRGINTKFESLIPQIGATSRFNLHSVKNISVDQQSKNNSSELSRIKYVNYLSLRLKKMLTPLYSSIPSGLKEKGLNLSNIQGWNAPVKNSHFEKRVEKIFRSYLSKKRTSFKKLSSLNLSNRKGSTGLKKVTLLTIQEKTKTLLGKNQNVRGYLTHMPRINSLRSSLQTKTNLLKIYTINSLLKSRVFLLKKKKPANIFLSDKYNFNSLKTLKLVDKLRLDTNLINPVLGNNLEKEEHNINPAYFYPPQNGGDGRGFITPPYIEKLEKHKYSQKKHRRKKQRKETRRRKKRKRFYPRPIWSRNKTYQNILLKLSLSEVKKPNIKVHSQKLLKKVSNFTKNDSFNFQNLVENLPLYSTKDFYQIKRSVLGELKRAFWKSYWLRSNLNPYLNQIKSNLKEIEKASTKETLYLHLRSLIMSVSGLNKSNFRGNGINMGSMVQAHNNYTRNFNPPKSSRFSDLTYSSPFAGLLGENKEDSQVDSGFPNLYTNLYFLNKQSGSLGNINLSSHLIPQWGISMAGAKPLPLNEVTGSTKTISTQNKWQLITQIAEHNRIMYERIQNLILNIRENLTLSGQVKARAYKRSGRLKFKSLATLKQVNPNNPQTNPDFWSKLGKTTASIFSQSSIKYYGDLSNNRLYWAMHKSNLGSFKNVNKIKSLWASTKNRDQSKANKTKKIFYDIQKKYASFLNYSFIKEKFNLDNEFWLNKKSPLNDLESRTGQGVPVSVGGNTFSNYPPMGDEYGRVLSKVASGHFTYYRGFAPIKAPAIELKSALLVSQRKIRHKEQKLLSLGLNNKQFGQNIKQPYGLVIKDSVLLPGHIKKLTNQITYWWTGSKMKIIPTFSTNYMSSSSSSLNFPTNLTVLGAMTFIFHFCALVSLISISQIRDFIKFILIVVSKVSKIYSQLIYSSLNVFGLINKGVYIPIGSRGLGQKTKIYRFKGWGIMGGRGYSSLNINSQFGQNIPPKLSLGPPNLSSFPSIAWKGKRMERAQQKVSGKRSLMPRINPIIGPKKVTYNLLVTIFKKLLTGRTASSKKFEKAEIASQNIQNWVFKTKTEYSPLKAFKSVYSIFLYSGINALIFSLSNFSFLTYSYFLKSLNLVEICIRSIYTFFEKPGELIIDWMAYFFLVEWSSDLTNTIPDTVDTTNSTSITKFSRSAARVEIPVFQSINLMFPPLLNTISNPFLYSSVLMPTAHFNKSLEQMTLGNFVILPSVSGSFIGIFSFLSGGLIQRRLLSMYDIFVTIACRPDTDLITRQQKGYIFWDLWSDLLIGVAEDSNINVSELSNLKEEQNRLLEKLLSLPTPGVAHTLSNSVYDTSGMYSISNSGLGPHLSNPFGNENLKSKRMNKLFKEWGWGSFIKPTLMPSQSLIGKGNLNKVRKINQKSLSKAISWSTSQFLSYQGKDTELFIDLHPPKSFEQLTSIKYSFSLNQPIGLVLCQIYSGLFYKQIAKNLLVVGPPGSEKSMLIQAIAGETELKIITDNAHRYALVFRGVAVGIKLLRDVFEALTLHTPCLFLLEDIHAIGERRPFLISDDENAKGIESSIYQDREEIHEKNQVAYQLTKHIISHYKKPYKGDFSLLIPTNHFCFDLFNSAPQNVQRTKTTNLTAGSPLAVNTKSNGSENNTIADNQQMSGNSKKAKSNSYLFSDNSNSLASSLQLPKNQLLAPPATSPFSVLVLKEEKKLKPKKIVKEFPWAGLPGEQYANVSKATYSIRVKVALLADMVLSNLSVKLDMITDLLVIIDSVKGNRGFVVFATTHVPYILDPALRRPGRFDETLSLPQIPNLLSRWYISKSKISLWHYKNSSNPKLTISSLNYGEPFSIYPIGVSFSLWETHTYKYLAPYGVKSTLLPSSTANAEYLNLFKNPSNGRVLSKVASGHFTYYRGKAPIEAPAILIPLRGINVNLTTILGPKNGASKTLENFNPVLNLSYFSFQTHKRKNLLFLNETKSNSLTIGQPSFRRDRPRKLNGSAFSFPMRKGQESRNLYKKQTILTMKVYNIVSRLLISLQQSTVQQPSQDRPSEKKQELRLLDLGTQTKIKNWGDFSFNLRMASMPSNSFLVSCAYKSLSKDSLIYTSLYSAPHIFKQHLTVLMAGQIGYTIAKGNLLGSNADDIRKATGVQSLDRGNTANLAPQGVINLTTDKTWRTATSLVFSFIQKRWIYQRHLLIPRLLDFGFEGSKPDIPSPPSSNILLPAKRYENYRRTFNYSQLKYKTNSSISEKIQFHQQQRLIKRLYKIPLKEFFRSEILNNHINDTKLVMNENRSVSNSMNQFTSFSNASIILAPLENSQQKPTSTNWYFRNRLLNRHRTYLSNQWWNGQLREHNPESTFLSDIDWRYTIKSTKEGGIGDLFIDFPDAEQYYNPKNQRWINSSGSWNSWFDFHKSSYDLYSSHYIFECLTNAYKTLDQNRELLDYYVVNLLEKGLGTNNELNEIEILELFKNRF